MADEIDTGVVASNFFSRAICDSFDAPLKSYATPDAGDKLD